MKVFGYNQPEEAKPFMRLACQAKANGNVSIVIPPWNGVFGKRVYGNVEDVELNRRRLLPQNCAKELQRAKRIDNMQQEQQANNFKVGLHKL